MRLDDRGTVTVEYVMVLALVALGCVPPLVLASRALLDLFLYQRSLLLLPFP